MPLFSDILLTVDFDRTFTAPDSSIPQINLEAAAYFMENGGAFTINTGRSLPMVERNILPYVTVNAPLLLYNGSAAYDVATGEISQAVPLPVDARTLYEDMRENFPSLYSEVHGIRAHYLFEKNRDWEIFSENNNCAWDYADPDKVEQPFIKMAVNGHFRGHNVASMYEGTPEELAEIDRVFDYLQEKYGDRMEIFRACPRIVDIHAKGCSKLAAARTLQKRLGRKLLVCVGDAQNDLAMLQGADYAFCPSDGKIAHLFPNVCCCSQGAVAEVIYKKIPAILQNNP